MSSFHDRGVAADDEERAEGRWKLLEAAMLAGASWPVALEAAPTVALDREARDQTYTLDADEVLAPSRDHETEDKEQTMLKQITGYPGGENSTWTATCDEFGRTLSGLYAKEAQAMKPLLAHVKDEHPDLAQV